MTVNLPYKGTYLESEGKMQSKPHLTSLWIEFNRQEMDFENTFILCKQNGILR